MLKTIVSPRETQYKHRESTQTKGVSSQRTGRGRVVTTPANSDRQQQSWIAFEDRLAIFFLTQIRCFASMMGRHHLLCVCACMPMWMCVVRIMCCTYGHRLKLRWRRLAFLRLPRIRTVIISMCVQKALNHSLTHSLTVAFLLCYLVEKEKF